MSTAPIQRMGAVFSVQGALQLSSPGAGSSGCSILAWGALLPRRAGLLRGRQVGHQIALQQHPAAQPREQQGLGQIRRRGQGGEGVGPGGEGEELGPHRGGTAEAVGGLVVEGQHRRHQAQQGPDIADHDGVPGLGVIEGDEPEAGPEAGNQGGHAPGLGAPGAGNQPAQAGASQAEQHIHQAAAQGGPALQQQGLQILGQPEQPSGGGQQPRQHPQKPAPPAQISEQLSLARGPGPPQGQAGQQSQHRHRPEIHPHRQQRRGSGHHQPGGGVEAGGLAPGLEAKPHQGGHHQKNQVTTAFHRDTSFTENPGNPGENHEIGRGAFSAAPRPLFYPKFRPLSARFSTAVPV